MNLKPEIEAIVPLMCKWRRHLHAHPETAFEESATARFVSDKLHSFGLKVSQGLGGTGVVGTLRRGTGDEAVALRADMDALHIFEKNAFEYKSKYEGKMHACGHDGHMAMLLGAAKYLSENETFNGTVHFIFQPAEENEGGGRKMVEDGLFEQYPVKAVFGLHNFPILPVGCFAVCPGPMMAAYDVFSVSVKGSGGHAAMPHLGQDTILAASTMVTMFQSIVSRNINPLDAAVISVTEFLGGTTWNVLPEAVTLRGTTRSFQESARDTIEYRMKEIVSGVATVYGVAADFRYEKRYPAVVNSPLETEAAIEAAARVVGAEKVLRDLQPLMGSEDFAFMLQKRPGALIALGSGGDKMLHQADYDFNDAVLPVGVGYWTALVESLLPKN